MKKLLYLFLAITVACADDEGNPCVYSPTLTTSAVTNITETSATLNGVISIVSQNCEDPTNTEQGFVYATTIQPTIANTQMGEMWRWGRKVNKNTRNWCIMEIK
jgi:hypothetical protein